MQYRRSYIVRYINRLGDSMKSSEVRGISRAISACKRCRSKKIKCSHDFPRCEGCEKANVECVSLDPATGRDVARSYIVSLEEEVEKLKKQLQLYTDMRLDDVSNKQSEEKSKDSNSNQPDFAGVTSLDMKPSKSIIDTLSSQRVSFSKLFLTALHYKGGDKKDPRNPSSQNEKTQSDPTTSSRILDHLNIALLPPKQQAWNLLALYFAQSNPQLPIFHRETFLREYFQPIYGDVPTDISFASLYTSLNNSMLTTIPESETWYYRYTELFDNEFNKNPNMNVLEFASDIEVPSKFKKPLYFLNIVFAIASSIWHLQFAEEIGDNFKTVAMKYIDDAYASNDRMEVLQAMLAHTLYSVMRPCVPGVWYLLGSTLRMCVDLGLHKEENDDTLDTSFFHKDMRRRLFWCCYSIDRQICVYLNRPFGIPEDSINVPFPSELDDSYIVPNTVPPDIVGKQPSYKSVSIAMFKVRLLEAELQSILHEKRDVPRKFDTFKDWLSNVVIRLEKWRNEYPKTHYEMNCDFNSEFFDLNYNHCRVMLHGISPMRFEFTNDDMVILADASMGMINSFYTLWERRSLNHTWAATHNVFMAGMSYLYAIFHGKRLQGKVSLDKAMKISEYVSVVLASLIDRCDAAKECLNVYQILNRAVLELVFPSSTYEMKTEHMQLLPSEQQIRTLQPGGNLTPNMKKLLNSIPSVRNSMYNKATSENNSGVKRELDYEFDDSINHKKQKGVAGEVLSLPAYDLDLDKFFEEVQKLVSPSENFDETLQNNISDIPFFNEQNYELNNNNHQSVNKTVGEGKKVYKMIYEVGTDSIWDQYFAKPFYEEE